MNIRQLNIVETPSPKETLDRVNLKDCISFYETLDMVDLGVIKLKLNSFHTLDNAIFFEIHAYGFISEEYIQMTGFKHKTCQLISCTMIENCTVETAKEVFRKEVETWKEKPLQSLIAAHIRFGRIDRTNIFSKYFSSVMS